MAQPVLKLVGPVAARQGRSPSTLASLCARVDLLEVVLAPRGLDVPVAGVRIHDPLDVARASDDLVLAPGVPTEDLLDASAAAVVVRRRGALSAWLLEAFADAGVALLTAPADLPWGELHVLALAALELGGDRAPGGGLAGLADATAALAGGPVTIEDLEGHVLAFSQGAQDIDPARAASVLERCTPERWMRELRRSGALDRVIRSGDVVRVELPGLAPRRALTIRAAGSALGAIWLAGEDAALSPAADAALRDAARAAALQLTRERTGEDLERRVRAGALRMLLAGEGAPAPLLAALGLPGDGELAVIAARQDGPATRQDLQRHADLLCAHLRADRLTAAAGVLDGRVYALAALAGATGQATVRRAVTDWLQRSSAALLAGLGEPAGADELASARRAADRCVELGSASGELIAYDAVHGRALLADVATLFRDESPALRALRAYDDERGTDYIATLRAFLSVHGDAGRTATALGIHVNTLRYRMRRLEEIAQLDLEDPEARLAVALELHALAQRRAAPGVTSPIS
jgi:PucR-like helix-turn-helix protein